MRKISNLFLVIIGMILIILSSSVSLYKHEKEINDIDLDITGNVLVTYQSGDIAVDNMLRNWSCTDQTIEYNESEKSYILSGKGGYCGWYFDLEYKIGTQYLLEYDIQKLDGKLDHIGGHSSYFDTEYFTVDDSPAGSRYSSPAFGNIGNDSEIHKVRVLLKNKDFPDSDDKKLYIQPNRRYSQDGYTREYVKVKITNLHIYELYGSEQVKKGSKVNLLDEPSIENYIFNGWYNKETNEIVNNNTIANKNTDIIAKFHRPEWNVNFSAGNIIEGQQLNLWATDELVSYDAKNGEYVVKKNDAFGGLEIPAVNFVQGGQYTLEWDVQKISGSLQHLGGYLTNSSQEKFYIDGVLQDHLYLTNMRDSDIRNMINKDDNEIHHVKVDFVYDDSNSIDGGNNYNVYIQPNRGDPQASESALVSRIFNIKLNAVEYPTIKVLNGNTIGNIDYSINKEGYNFIKWVNEFGETYSSDMKITKDMTFKPIYEPKEYDVILNYRDDKTPNDSIKLTFDQIIDPSKWTIPKREGYTFKSWNVKIHNNYYSPEVGIIGEGDRIYKGESEIYAVWEINKNGLQVSSSPYGIYSGSVNGEKPYGTKITLTAIPKTGYKFAGWIDENCNIVSTDLTYEFNMPDHPVYLRMQYTYDVSQINSVKVLNVYPDLGNNLKGWMNSFGQGKIQVDEVSIINFNNNPSNYLGTSGNWKYDVVVFGFWDANNSLDLSIFSRDLIKNFMEENNAVIFGHDTLSLSNGPNGGSTHLYHPNFASLSNFVNIINKADWAGVGNVNQGTTLTIYKNGIFTKYPYDIGVIGTKLIIPSTHNLDQIANGDIWLKLADSGVATGTANFYLTTYRNRAMIQTGHSSGQATEDEQKILTNLIFYLYSYNKLNTTQVCS